jgi:hypothetical protein
MPSPTYGISGLSKNALSSYNIPPSLSEKIITVKRVKDIILNQDHPKFEEYGEWASIGIIFAEDVTSPSSTPSTSISIIYPLFPNIKQYPLLNEIVVVLSLPSTDLEQSTNSSRSYYFPPINIWGSQHHNAIPGSSNSPPPQQKDYQQIEAGSFRKVTDGGTEIELGNTFIEQLNINPLQPFEGDHILEGRFGNSLRFGSSQGKDPLIKIRNGQGPQTSEGWTTVEENIQEDKASIYLTSTQQIPLNPNIFNYNSYSTSPESVNQYSKPQILLNSGRIVLNANQDHVLLNTAKSINLNSQDSVNIDSKNKVIVNSPQIYLGGKDATEPILLGNKTIDLLRDVLIALQSTLNQLQVLTSLPPGAPFAPLNIQSAVSNQTISKALASLETLKSPNNKTL